LHSRTPPRTRHRLPYFVPIEFRGGRFAGHISISPRPALRSFRSSPLNHLRCPCSPDIRSTPVVGQILAIIHDFSVCERRLKLSRLPDPAPILPRSLYFVTPAPLSHRRNRKAALPSLVLFGAIFFHRASFDKPAFAKT